MLPEACIFIVDDNIDMLASLGLLIRSAGYRTRAYESAEQFLNDYDPADPGCLLLDVRMSGMNGLDLQQHLCRFRSCPPTILLSGFADVPGVVRAMQFGAIDFLQKPADESVLLQRIEQALAIDRQQREYRARFATLTDREHEVLPLLVEGQTTRAIANQLHISPKTVEKHRVNILSKLDVDSVVDLVRITLPIHRAA